MNTKINRGLKIKQRQAIKRRQAVKQRQAVLNSVGLAKETIPINPLTQHAYKRKLVRINGKELTQIVHYPNELGVRFSGSVIITDKAKATIGELHFEERHENFVKGIFLHGIETRKTHQDLGLATQMISEAIELIRKKSGIKRVYLHVSPANKKAIELYKKFGFKLARKVNYGLEMELNL